MSSYSSSSRLPIYTTPPLSTSSSTGNRSNSDHLNQNRNQREGEQTMIINNNDPLNRRREGEERVGGRGRGGGWRWYGAVMRPISDGESRNGDEESGQIRSGLESGNSDTMREGVSPSDVHSTSLFSFWNQSRSRGNNIHFDPGLNNNAANTPLSSGKSTSSKSPSPSTILLSLTSTTLLILLIMLGRSFIMASTVYNSYVEAVGVMGIGMDRGKGGLRSGTISDLVKGGQGQSETPHIQQINPHDGSKWNETLSLELQNLAIRFSPIIKLHSEEEFYPSSVDYMIPHYSSAIRYTSDSTATEQVHPRASHRDNNDGGFQLDRFSLPTLPFRGSKTWLSIREPHDAQPNFPSLDSSFLYGPNGETLNSRRDRNGQGPRTGRKTALRKKVEEEVYCFVVRHGEGGMKGARRGEEQGKDEGEGEGVVDLWYWTFWPYNLGKEIWWLGYLGNHLGDWEIVKVRTINGTGHSVDYSVHDNLSAGTWRWDDVEKIQDRPVAYAAKGSHGLWPTSGAHVYRQALNGLFKLIDYTDDEGTIWDTQPEVIPWVEGAGREGKYETNGKGRRPRYDLEGKNGWLNFVGRWGEKANTGCWFYSVGKMCSMADSPGGPNRWLGGAPKCVIGQLNPSTSKKSRITFTLDSSALEFAANHNLTLVKAEAVCSDTSGWKEVPGDDPTGAPVQGPASREMISRLKDTIELDKANKTRFDLEFEACPTSGWRKTYLTGYKLSLCNVTMCNYVSPPRDICTYLPNTPGYTSGQSVDLVDNDPMSWWYEGSKVKRPKPVREGDARWSFVSMLYLWLSAYFEVFW